MNEILLDAIYITIGLIVLILSFMGSLNFLMKGMPIAYLKVRISNGKKVLVRVNSAIDKYWTTGFIRDRILYFRLRGSKDNTCINNITEEHYYHSMGVFCLDVNEEGPFALSRNQTIPANLPDATIFDNIIKRAMMAPSENTKQFIILLIGLILIFLVVCFCAYKINQLTTLVTALRMLSGNV
jgi:hypothetical protein